MNANSKIQCDWQTPLGGNVARLIIYGPDGLTEADFDGYLEIVAFFKKQVSRRAVQDDYQI